MISQGNAFMKYREKNKNKYEGFRQRKIETPVYDASNKVYGNNEILNTQDNSELIQSQKSYLSDYSNTFNKVTEKSQDYVNRISPSNPYLNKFVHFTNDPIVYVTNLGVAKPISSWETYQSLLGKNGCPSDAVSAPMEWNGPYIEGSTIPLKPSLVVGPPMNPGESCGNEGKNVYVSSLISKDAIAAYEGCYQDSSPSIMTFIGEVPPVKIDASITNGDFSQPVIANNTYDYYSESDHKVPGWDFTAVLANDSNAWGYVKPYPVGQQYCSIQGQQYIRQHINFSPGTYTLTFYSAGRNCCDGSGLSNPINIVIDSQTKDTWTIYNFQPPLDKWKSYSVPVNIYAPGMHSISFEGTWSASDRSSALQGIRLSSSGSVSAGSGNYTYDQCKTAAIDGGYQYFGIQYGNPSTGKGYCAVSNDSVSATKNGTSYAISAALPLWASNTSNTDAGNIASLTIQGSLSVINSQGAVIFSTKVGDVTGSNENTGGFSDGKPTPSNYVGCYGDTGNRAMPNTSNGQYFPLEKCKQLAEQNNYSYYAVQNNNNTLNGWCAGSNDLNEIKKYGIASNCSRLSDGTIGGGGWANAVYKIDSPPSDYFMMLKDEGVMCLYKGIFPYDNQGLIWEATLNGPKQKPNPAFAASKGKYGRNFIKTGDTLAAGDFVGSSDGSIYLIMQSDGNLVLYTSSSAENCSKTADGSSSMGGQGATALYKMSEVGNPANLGKIGYVDKNSEIYMYPDNKIGLSNNYVKHVDSGSAGNDIPGAASSGGSLNQCKNICNSLSECYGFEYHSSVNVCYPKDKNMYPVGPKQSLNVGNGDDLYVREKLVKEGFETGFNLIENGDFSSPRMDKDTAKYTTATYTLSVPNWEFAAILNNGDGWSELPKPMPYGDQCAYIQYVGYITQQINDVSIGTYNLTFASTGRQTGWNTESNGIDIILDKETTPVTVLSFQPPLGKWKDYSVSIEIKSAGTHSITFQGQGNARDTTGGYDVSSAIQGVTLISNGSGSDGGASGGKGSVEIDTNKWKNYTNNNKIFDDSIVDSVSKQLSDADKKQLADLNNQISRFSQDIELNNMDYKQKLSNVNSRTVENTGFMDNYYDEYDTIQSKIKTSRTNLINMDNIVSDTNILVIQQNAHYVLYAMIAIILLIITIKFLS